MELEYYKVIKRLDKEQISYAIFIIPEFVLLCDTGCLRKRIQIWTSPAKKIRSSELTSLWSIVDD